jgi:hypothetical protein
MPVVLATLLLGRTIRNIHDTVTYYEALYKRKSRVCGRLSTIHLSRVQDRQHFSEMLCCFDNFSVSISHIRERG